MAKVKINLTAKMIERAVDDLFINGQNEVATRLVLVDESSGKPGRDLGGLCPEAVVDRLCEAFGVNPPDRRRRTRRKN
jgi:hypothetical protein